MIPKPRVLVLTGPTAVGKSNLVYNLLPRYLPNIEVVCADSRQIYRGMDIGTAKPSPTEQALLPHHLIDLRQPTQQFSLGDFVREAEEAIPAIHGRGNIPVLVGGTGFYLRGLLFGLSKAPPGDSSVRRELEHELEVRGREVLAQELAQIDPQSSKAIAPGDTYRLLRALEIYRVSGRPRSDFTVATEVRGDWEVSLVVLDRPREEVYARIYERVTHMFAQGLVEEVRKLLAQGIQFSDPGMQAIGYKEFCEPGAFENLSDTANRVAQNTRHYAKRQYTFFRKFSGAGWVHPERKDELLAALGVLGPKNHAPDIRGHGEGY